jgi:SPP1 gp7 family putative phage head morphogenesis protein
MSIPEVFFRETIDVGRFSNALATKYVQNYAVIILTATDKLKKIDLRQQKAAEGVVIAPQTRKRLRAIIAQSKASMDKWSKETTKGMIKEIADFAEVQTSFIENELKKAVKSGNIPINSVAVNKKYASSFIKTDPTEINIFTSKQFTEDDFKNFGSGKFELTARQGAMQTLPNGQTVEKAFRGIAKNQQDILATNIRAGVFSGESTAEIARRMAGRLDFDKIGNARQIAAAGGQSIKVAANQIQTIVRTSVNQVQNQASQAVYAANSKVAPKYEYVATLDSRTSGICKRLDGRKFEYNKGPTPPQHFNCRSTTVPVVDYEGLSKRKEFEDLKPPSKGKVVTRPTGEGTGRVPQDTQYGDWLLGQDKKLKVKTLGNEQKVRYFERLAKKEGSGQKAIRKMIREDGSERSLADLQKLYGKPNNITLKTTTPKPVAKPIDFKRRLADSSPEQLRKDGKAIIDEVGGIDVKKLIKLEDEFKVAAKKTGANLDPKLADKLASDFEKAKKKYFDFRDNFEAKMAKIKEKMLETSLTDVQVNKFADQVNISSSFTGSEQSQIKNIFREYIRLFNGAGFTEAANGVPAANTVGKARRASCTFWKGKFSTSVNRQGVVNKSTTFHEITHIVEVANPKLNNYMNEWKFQQAFGERGATKVSKELRDQFMAKPRSPSSWEMTEKLQKPVYTLRSITGNTGYRSSEVAFLDKYKDAYMGKVYDMFDYDYSYIKGKINPSEVLTMSIQEFADPSLMGKLYRTHPDLFELVVGMSRATNL